MPFSSEILIRVNMRGAADWLALSYRAHTDSTGEGRFAFKSTKYG